jgi:hypothetical protein
MTLEAISAFDTVNLDITKELIDTFGVYDTYDYFKAKGAPIDNDTLVLLDDISLNLNKALTDTIIITDTTFVDRTNNLTESIIISDVTNQYKFQDYLEDTYIDTTYFGAYPT